MIDDKDNICPKCGFESMSGDEESYGEQEYSTEFMCEECDTEWTSYYKYDRKEIHEELVSNNPPVATYDGKIKGAIINIDDIFKLNGKLHEQQFQEMLKKENDIK